MLLANGSTVSLLSPQSLAEVSPQISTSYYYPDSLGLQLEREFALFGEIYAKQPWVRTVIDKRAAAVARLPVDVWDINGDTRSRDTRSRYAALIANPCEYLDNYSFWSWVQTTIDIYGETYLAMVKDDNGMPISFMPMHPSRVAVIRDTRTNRYSYTFQAGTGVAAEMVRFPQEDVVPFRLFNPKRVERGLSRMESLKSTIFAEDSSRNATAAMWGNAGRPNIVLTSDKALGQAGRERLAGAFKQAHGGSSNAGKALVLEDGVTAAAFQLTAIEMQFIESRHLNREEVCGVYDTAPPIVHILDKATFSNISAQMRAFYRDTMAPPLELIQSVMDKYVGSYWARKNKMRFAVDDVIRGDWETRSQSGQAAVNSGGMTPNEYRELMGLNRSDDPKADTLYANSAMQPLGSPSERITLSGAVDGSTPDGVDVQPALPASTPIAAMNNGRPTLVPRLNPKPATDTGQPAKPISTPAPPGPRKPTEQPKHLRRVKGELGRDKDIKHVAERLFAEYPDDWQDILRAVEIAVRDQHERHELHDA